MTAALKLVSEDTTMPILEGYRVLARKYRPIKLSQIIGQDFLVETLKRGIEGGRLGHAFILTGIRGTGKTTTARIIARALNCAEGPTPEPCGACSSCMAIAQDRSMDVIEIDAASRTSVDDIREIIEASRYKAVSSRYKIYIIDEVHMLSKSAFNALLKTLEEPPPHVKFIFATTEIHKVPATILSRCVRFDLKRIESPTLVTYFKTLCEQEAVVCEEEALGLIAKAAEGSVRDGLSLLDQAMTYGTSQVTAVQVRQMLGLSDQGLLFEFFQALMEGETLSSLEKLRFFYQEGADPLRILEDLLDLTHWLQCLKMSPSLAQDITLTPEKKQKGLELAETLSIPTLTRVWQILLKGFEEVKRAPSPQKALEVIVIRLTHLTPLPSLHDLLNRGEDELPLKKKVLSEVIAETHPAFASFEDLVEWVSQQREGLLHGNLMYDIHLVTFSPPTLTLRLTQKAPKNLPQQLQDLLKKIRGEVWTIAISEEIGHPTLYEKEQKAREEHRETILQDPLVKTVMEAFPGTTLVEIEDK